MKKHFLLIPVLLAAICSHAQIDKVKDRSIILKDRPVMVNTPPAVIKNVIKAAPAYDFSNVKICIDAPLVANNNLPPRNTAAGKSVPKINPDGTLSQVGVSQQPLVGALDKMWNPGDVIKVYLDPNNGSDNIRFFVKKYAQEWEKYANVKFEFVTDFNAAHVKVGFNQTGQSWSWVGRDVLFNPFKKYTMNFGWFDGGTFESEFSRTVSHEFGHVLGFMHEHQSPASPLQWDKPKTYAYFEKKEHGGWSAAEVDQNVINRYSQSNTNFSSYDKNSIMHYFIPSELLLGGGSVGGNYMLSGTDIQYARMWYPFPVTDKNATGSLRTNDDCDDVAFSVEYNVVPADQVEFSIELGVVGSKKVTWWKQIGIPRTNNTETNVWAQNHSLIQSENKTSMVVQIPVNEINVNKPISFWKAKLLGVHTLLPFKWNVLPAIKGGCRVKLVWNKDSCL